MVGDLTVGHRARRKLAVPDVLQGEVPGASRALHGLYRRAVYVEPDRRCFEESGPLYVLGTLNRTYLSLRSAIYASPLSRR